MILDKVREMVAYQFNRDLDAITADTLFVDDLGADSLDIVELTMALEEEYSLAETNEEELAKLNSVGDLAEYVANMVEGA